MGALRSTAGGAGLARRGGLALIVLACAALLGGTARASTVTLDPNGEAGPQEWVYIGTPASYLGLADDDDSSGIRADFMMQRHYVAMENLPASGAVCSVTVRVRAYDDAPTPDRIRLSLWVADGWFDSSTEFTLENSVAEYSFTWGYNPITWEIWTPADVNALLAGVVRTSEYSPSSPKVTKLWIEVNYAANVNYWVGGYGQNWTTGANWSLGRPPLANETAIVPDSYPNDSPVVNQDAVCGGLWVFGYGQVMVGGGVTLDVAGDVVSRQGSGEWHLNMLASGSILKCGGVWDVPDPWFFYAGNGTVVLYGASADQTISAHDWNNLTVDVGDRTLRLAGNSQVAGGLTVSSGTVLAGTSDQLTANGPVTVESGGTLELAGSATLRLGSSLTVEAGAPNGRFVATGTTPTVTWTATDNRYSFTVDGEIDVGALNFSGADANGLTLSDGAVVTSLDNVTFTTGVLSGGGTYLRVLETSEAVFSFYDHQFDTSTVSTMYNVSAYDAAGVGPRVNMIGWSGMSGGPTRENDPGNHINWYGTTTDLTVQSVSSSATDPNLGETIDVTVTVANAGSVDDDFLGICAVGLYYNRSTPPSPGDAPDLVMSAGPLSGGGATEDVVFAGVAAGAGHEWEMYALVDWSGAIPEPDELNNAGGPEQVTWHGPDLVVTMIVPSDANPVAGVDTITVDVTIRNLGDADAVAPFDVGLFYDQTPPPSVGDDPTVVGGQTQAVADTLGPGDEVTLPSFTGITSPVASPWSTWAIVDNKPSGGDVAEVGEKNNVGGPVVIAWQPIPDLVVNWVRLRDIDTGEVINPPYEPDVGDAVRIEAEVANVGQAPAVDFGVGLYHDLTSPPEILYPEDGKEAPLTLLHGHSTVVDFVATSAKADIWQMYVLADCDGVSGESNEANNAFGPVEVNWGGVTGIRVVSPNGGETWVAGTTQQIRWNTYGATIGQNLMIEYSENAGGTWNVVEASYPDNGFYDWSVPGVNSTICLVRVTSEASGTIEETQDVSDRTFRAFPPALLKPNLTILSVVPSNDNPNGDETITVDVLVRNNGYSPAGAFYVHLYYDRSWPPGPAEFGDQPGLVTGLTNDPTGNAYQTTLQFTGIASDSAGIWNMYSIVDPQDYVHELNESEEDNASGPKTVTWRRFWLLAPGVGEEFSQGSVCTVKWSSTLLLSELVKIELSPDAGGSWTVLTTATENDGSYEWLVTCPPSDGCLIRISSGGVAKTTEGVFTVVEPMDLFGGGCGARVDGPGAGRRGPVGGAQAAGWAALIIAAWACLIARSRCARAPHRP